MKHGIWFSLALYSVTAFAIRAEDHGSTGRVETTGDDLTRCRHMVEVISSDPHSPYRDVIQKGPFRKQYLSTCVATAKRTTSSYVSTKRDWGLPFDPSDVIGEVFRTMMEAAKVSKEVSDQLWAIIKGFQHGKGFGVSVTAGAVAQAKVFVEGIVHNGEFGLFCGGGAGVMTDIGVGVDAYGVQTFGCKDNKAYSGGFLNFGLGVSFEVADLPVAVGGAISFGIDLDGFVKKAKPIVADLAKEAEDDSAELLGLIGDILKLATSDPETYGIQSLMVLGAIDQALPEKTEGKGRTRKALAHAEAIIGEKTKKVVVSSDIAKNPFSLPTKLAGVVAANKHASALFTALTDSATGCNALSASVGAQVSLSPISVSANVTDYYQLGGFDVATVLNAPNLASPLGAGIGIWNGTYEKDVKKAAEEIAKVADVISYLSDPTKMEVECAKRAAKSNVGRLREVIGK